MWLPQPHWAAEAPWVAVVREKPRVAKARMVHRAESWGEHGRASTGSANGGTGLGQNALTVIQRWEGLGVRRDQRRAVRVCLTAQQEIIFPILWNRDASGTSRRSLNFMIGDSP